jgi:predicted permease
MAFKMVIDAKGDNMVAYLLSQQIIQLFLMMFCGFVLVRSKLLKSTDSKTLSILVVYLICPCTILNAFQIEYSSEAAANFLLAVGSAVTIHILLFLIVYGLSRIFHFTNIEKASLIYSNAGNLIIPLVTAILGEEWVLYASAFMVVQLFIIWTQGKSLVEGRKGSDLKAILTNVNLIACFVGLALFLLHIQLPSLLRNTVKTLGSTVGPVSMIMLGMILAGTDIVSMARGKRIWIITFFKMIAVPCLVLLIMKFSGIANLTPQGETIIYISLLATMTPSATTVTQMAQLYDQDVSYATAINTITTLVCIATMPLMTMLYYL